MENASAADKSTPSQVFGTDGIKPMARPGLLARAFVAVVAWAERLNLKYSKVGNPPIYDNSVFPWAEAIEREWRTIRNELDAVLLRKNELPAFQDISTDVATISQDNGWKTYLLVGYGIRSERNIAQCPNTWRIVRKIPGLKTAMFSIFEPGKHLPAHRGPYNGVLRLHLGLLVPEPRESRLSSSIGMRAGCSSLTTPMSMRRGTAPQKCASCCSSTSSNPFASRQAW